MTREQEDKLHLIALKYSEDSAKIKCSMTVIKVGFVQNIVKDYLENMSCLSCKHSSIRFNIDCNLLNKLDLPENFYCNKWESK